MLSNTPDGQQGGLHPGNHASDDSIILFDWRSLLRSGLKNKKDKTNANPGVPQGSIMIPTLFLFK